MSETPTDAIRIVGGLVTDPDVVLFDEANNALDRDADARLLALLKDGLDGRIMILVSNRPSYLELATRVIDLDDFVECRTVECLAS